MGTTKEGKGSAVSGIRGMGKCRGIATAEALVALVIVVAAIALAAYSYFGVSAPTATTTTTIPTATASTTITILTGPESAYDVNASYLPAGSPTYAASAAKLTISKIAVPQSANGSILLAYSSLLKNTSAISGNDVVQERVHQGDNARERRVQLHRAGYRSGSETPCERAAVRLIIQRDV